jgi:hypothetical protein
VHVQVTPDAAAPGGNIVEEDVVDQSNDDVLFDDRLDLSPLVAEQRVLRSLVH